MFIIVCEGKTTTCGTYKCGGVEVEALMIKPRSIEIILIINLLSSPWEASAAW